MKKSERKLFFQKGNITLEFVAYDRVKDSAEFLIDLGDLDTNIIQHEDCGMPLNDFIAKLENVVKRLKKHKGDVFVVQ